MGWKSLASWSGRQIALLGALWVVSVIGYIGIWTAIAQQASTQSTDTYFIVVHVHHPLLVFCGPPVLLLAVWLWRRFATRPAS